MIAFYGVETEPTFCRREEETGHRPRQPPLSPGVTHRVLRIPFAFFKTTYEQLLYFIEYLVASLNGRSGNQ